MLRAVLHPRVVITTLAAVCVVAAWSSGCATSAPNPGDFQTTLLDRAQTSDDQGNWLAGVIERDVDEGVFADSEDDNERLGIRKHVDLACLGHTHTHALLVSIHSLLAPICSPRSNSPGARRGPPPRMPPA